VPPTADPHSANCNSTAQQPVDVGSYPGSPSPSGGLDLAGNVIEWNESDKQGEFAFCPPVGACRGFRGGGWLAPSTTSGAALASGGDPFLESKTLGFRVASRVPGVPGLGPLGAALLASIVGAACWRSLRNRRSSG